jgi:predicted house-cleaning noncanonical NTP pyrophosphatase (MazG superfamily)
MRDGKLVRDRIPEIIRAAGGSPNVRDLDDDTAYHAALRKKLLEETREFLDSGRTEELADILEVVYALALSEHLTPFELEAMRQKKRSERGGFDRRLLLEG